MTNVALAELIDSFDAQAAQLQSVQAQRVQRILLVASLYDSFTLSEGKHLAELIFGTYYDLSLSAALAITRVSTRREALAVLAADRYDIVITMSQVADMSAAEFGRQAKTIRSDLPVFLLAYSLEELRAQEGGPLAIPGIDRTFIWRGDVRLFLAIIKLVEDAMTADHDTAAAGVRVIILVEDSVAFYSSYLPMLLTEVVRQTASLIAEEVNIGQRMLRRRLRPKILLATSYEEGWDLYRRYQSNVLCVISDVHYPRNGREDPEAGLALLAAVRAENAQTPLLLQSSQAEVAPAAAGLGAAFVRKHSPTILADLHAFMLDRLGFGDFVFRLPDGREVARARHVAEMLLVLASVPAEALQFHGLRHDFSNWLMARTEFAMATALRALEVSDFESLEAMRAFLIDTLNSVQAEKRRGQVEDFHATTFGHASAFVRIGGGSLGGKGRGLAFVHELLGRGRLPTEFDGVRLVVPHSTVVGTDVFDRFLDANGLRGEALRSDDDRAILQWFVGAPLPSKVMVDLEAFLRVVRGPLAVRSSSLLEDSQLVPAAGIYPTHMLPNTGDDLRARLADLSAAIKHMYASVFFRRAKAYLAATASLVEDEKMAVVVQEVVGRRHGDLVYPDLSGTAASHNFYPMREMTADEGVALLALGLGQTIADGERAVRFSPAHPQWLPQFATPRDILDNAQREFCALDLNRPLDFLKPEPGPNVVHLPLAEAERHGTLRHVASTYSPDDDAVYDGLSRPGTRLVTMAPVLRTDRFGVVRALRAMLELGSLGMSVPVEMEFAVDLEPTDGGPPRFAVLQVRPMGHRGTGGAVRLDALDPADVFVHCEHALGVGRDASIRDIVAVRLDTFDRASTEAIADEIGTLNARLVAEGRRYVLIGPGRWGTADRWLGVPVAWAQISGARAIVECGTAQLDVEPSQGSHFFHNLTSLGIPYFTVGRHVVGRVDWAWVDSLTPLMRTERIALYRFDHPLEVLIDDRSGVGVILKPRAPVS